ncbi:MarR family transcriptional regulator [Pseudofrankia asymbiotica]|uniref:MarR family transcriptional regulator n=2 Tax=Pseudofrankia asymbiotica TaxID=1834516 RepID=A0A1V2I3Z0_9ACTN|nr:MarR family transcriptional regulator [Pseudofrankia asymbiotica]
MIPSRSPIGLHLARTARMVSRAFDEALAAGGGSMPLWLVLLNLKTGGALANQRELARAVGIREATLTHHLNAIEGQGLVVRRRDPANRRVQTVELTAAGEEAFLRLREIVVDFDRRLREGFADQEIVDLERQLDRLVNNVAGT